MIGASDKPSIGSRALLGGLFAILLSGVSAQAADPTFPAGSRIGLVPPSGMAVSHTFMGFEDVAKKAAFVLAALPAAAFAQLDESMVPGALHQQGIDVDKREPITVGTGKGFLLSGEQTTDNVRYHKWLMVIPAGDVTALVTVQVPEQDNPYPEKAVRDALATLAVRASVPDAERLGLLPFTVGDLAGFHIDDVLPGRALMLTEPAADDHMDAGKDAGKETSKGAAATPLNARFLIAALEGGPAESDDRGNFARVMFDQIAGLKDVRVQDAEPLRLSNQFGYQTLAKAKDAQTDTDLMVVQWLRFGSGGFMQMIGIARADVWPDVFNRLRTVRDSVDPR